MTQNATELTYRVPIIEQSTDNFQSNWENLINKSQASGHEERESLGMINLGDELYEEFLFARPGHSGPEVGALLLNNETTLTYACKCFRGRPEAYGEIMVAEPYIAMSRGNKGALIPVDKAGGLAMRFSMRYDQHIVWAIVNTLKEKVLHTIKIGYGESNKKNHYLTNGYHLRKNYSNVVDRVYEPK